ncbi:MAG: hypothetical protein GY841_10785 [FCB group bacterium]|nr:hypothetical protein [FCB group bacterium]
MYIRLFVLILLTFSITITPTTIKAQLNSDELPAIELMGYQPTLLVDCPTAGTLQRGSFNTVMRAYPNGGILTRTAIGLSNRLMVGVSYGAEGILAEERPNWNPRIEFDVKLSIVDEGLVFPAASIGFCSQGYGSYINDLERYTYKSKGFYVVASKNYPLYNWQVGFHGGLNYSTEQEDDDDDLDFFIGLDTRLNQDVGLVMEYDFATNDNRDLNSAGKGRGYLNLSLQWLYADNLVMEFMLKNLNNNRKGTADIWRGLRVTYVESF